MSSLNSRGCKDASRQGLTSYQSFLENQSSPIEISFLLTVNEKDGIMLVARSKMFHFLMSCDQILDRLVAQPVYNIIRK